MANNSTPTYKKGDVNGKFQPDASKFRSFISADPSSAFPAERDRYVLYVNYGCPFAHWANIVRSLKGLDDVIQLVITDFILTPSDGWAFNPDRKGTDPVDPLYGFTHTRQLYEKADPEYKGRYSVPILWDKTKETIVNNESSEIIRMFYTEFDGLLPEGLRETSRPLLPAHLKADIEAMNEWVYETVNIGVYKAGFSNTQEAYEGAVFPLFKSLDRLEEHLGQPGHHPYLFGDRVTEADVRLYTSLIRFDSAYYTMFKCNLKMIRLDYPHLHDWLRRLYWDANATVNGAFKKTTNFEHIKGGYARSALKETIVPVGPDPPILPLDAK